MRPIPIRIGTVLEFVAGVLVCSCLAFGQQKQSAAPASKSSPFSPQPGTSAPASTAKPSQATTAPGAPSSTPAAPSGKRRDPFRTLIPEKKPESAEAAPIKLPPGKKGLVIEQLQLQGIAQAVDGSWIAVVDNKTKRSYFLHEKDQLYNGTVSKITKDEIVFLENPPGISSGKMASREVVKRLTAE